MFFVLVLKTVKLIINLVINWSSLNNFTHSPTYAWSAHTVYALLLSVCIFPFN